MSNDVNKNPVEKINRSEEWDKKLEEVREFASNNKRWPSTTSDDPTEKSLAQWWSRQKYYFNKFEQKEESPGINEDRANRIKATIASFESYERDGIWDVRYNIVVKQLKEHGKMWSYKTTNKEEEKIGRWWNQQKTFYRKFRKGETSSGMNEERAQKIEEVLKMLNQEIEERIIVAHPLPAPAEI